MKKKTFKIKYVYAFTLTLFIIGFFYGTIIFQDFGFLVNKNYVEDYILRTDYARTPSLGTVLSNLMGEVSYFFILWFLSLTIIGIIVVVFVVFFTGFTYGFTLRFFITQYGYQGVYLGFLYTFPKNIILIPLLIYFTSQAMINTFNIISAIYFQYNRKTIRAYIHRYFNLLFFVIGILVLYTLVDAILFKMIGERLRMTL